MEVTLQRPLTRFQLILRNTPQPNTLLLSKTSKPVPVYVSEYEEERRMFAYVAIDDERTGWYLSEATRGLKALIMSNSQDHLIAMNNGSIIDLTVQALMVVKWTKKYNALITETVAIKEEE